MTPAPTSGMRRVAGRARWLALPCAFGLLLPLLGRLWSSSSNTAVWLLDLAAHWQLLYALGWLALCVICAARTWRWLLLVPLALLPLFSTSMPLQRVDDGKPALIVAAANVNVGNRDPARLVAWLRAQPADVVMLSELTPAYAAALVRQLGDEYPHREFAPDDSPFGIGLLSRSPLTAVELHTSTDGIPFLTAMIKSGNVPIRVVAVHPMPPMAPHWHGERDTLLRMLAQQAGRTPHRGRRRPQCHSMVHRDHRRLCTTACTAPPTTRRRGRCGDAAWSAFRSTMSSPPCIGGRPDPAAARTSVPTTTLSARPW